MPLDALQTLSVTIRFASGASLETKNYNTYLPALAWTEMLVGVRSYLSVDSMISGKFTVK